MPSPTSVLRPNPSNVTSAIAHHLLGTDSALLSDSSIETSDNIHIPVVRALLASRSAYFKSAFFSPPSDRVLVQFPSHVINQVVEYAYTDTSTLLSTIADLASTVDKGGQVPCGQAVELVNLATAAHYFDMHHLTTLSCALLWTVVEASPRTSCAILGAIRQSVDPCETLKTLSTRLVAYIADNPRDRFALAPCQYFHPDHYGATSTCFGVCGKCTVMHLDVSTLQQIITETSAQFKDEYLLEIIYFWSTGGSRFQKRAADTTYPVLPLGDVRLSEDGKKTHLLLQAPKELLVKDEDSIEQLDATTTSASRRVRSAMDLPFSTNDPRWIDGMNLAARFDLMSMDPAFLHDYVEHSGILDKDCLYGAYRHHALSTRRRFPKMMIRARMERGFSRGGKRISIRKNV